MSSLLRVLTTQETPMKFRDAINFEAPHIHFVKKRRYDFFMQLY